MRLPCHKPRLFQNGGKGFERAEGAGATVGGPYGRKTGGTQAGKEAARKPEREANLYR
jgi:hypothetical protein